MCNDNPNQESFGLFVRRMARHPSNGGIYGVGELTGQHILQVAALVGVVDVGWSSFAIIADTSAPKKALKLNSGKARDVFLRNAMFQVGCTAKQVEQELCQWTRKDEEEDLIFCQQDIYQVDSNTKIKKAVLNLASEVVDWLSVEDIAFDNTPPLWSRPALRWWDPEIGEFERGQVFIVAKGQSPILRKAMSVNKGEKSQQKKGKSRDDVDSQKKKKKMEVMKRRVRKAINLRKKYGNNNKVHHTGAKPLPELPENWRAIISSRRGDDVQDDDDSDAEEMDKRHLNLTPSVRARCVVTRSATGSTNICSPQSIWAASIGSPNAWKRFDVYNVASRSLGTPLNRISNVVSEPFKNAGRAGWTAYLNLPNRKIIRPVKKWLFPTKKGGHWNTSQGFVYQNKKAAEHAALWYAIVSSFDGRRFLLDMLGGLKSIVLSRNYDQKGNVMGVLWVNEMDMVSFINPDLFPPHVELFTIHQL
jgi:hypothetical protein